jgi:hypothetical protein
LFIVTIVIEIGISEFKAKCLDILEPANWLGCMVGTGRIKGVIVSSISSESEWEAFR